MTMRSVGLMVVVAGVLGCGGDDSSNDNTSIDDTTISTSMTEGGSSSSASGSESSTSASTSMTTTTESGSSSADSGSSSVDSGSSSAESGSSSTDTGSGGPDGVECFFAPAPCVVGEVCCEDVRLGESSCIDADAQCMGVALICDGPEDCLGQLCCGTNDGGSECADSCEGYHLCHDDGDCNEGESCCPNGGGSPNGPLDHCTTLEMGMECPQPP
jgi:hypothetical protein